MSICFIINLQLYKDSIIGAYTLFWDSIDLAKLTSYCGDRYEWVVRRTCVVRAISKDVLARRGLVSCSDYYAIRHSLKTN